MAQHILQFYTFIIIDIQKNMYLHTFAYIQYEISMQIKHLN